MPAAATDDGDANDDDDDDENEDDNRTDCGVNEDRMQQADFVCDE